MNKKRALLTSCSVILLCICIIVGMSYALFTDTVSVGNHLKAGKLDVTLTRTDLEYSVLNADGELQIYTVSEAYDFTDSTDENVFGITASDKVIVPGSYFKATMQLSNNGNVAFDYRVEIKLFGDASELAEQIKVTVTHPYGTETTAMLSELDEALSVANGKMKATDEAQSFSIKLEFTDCESNNDAMDKTTAFDIIVTAVQSTAQTPSEG